MSWEFTLDRLEEIRANPREAMIGRQEAERMVDHYLADYKRGSTCSHCSRDMTKRPEERCSNGGLCVSIEEFDQRKARDKRQAEEDRERLHKSLIEASEELLRIAYASGRGGLVEFRPHEFDDLKAAVDQLTARNL